MYEVQCHPRGHDAILNAARHQHAIESRRESTEPPDEYDGVVGVPVSKPYWSASSLSRIGSCPFKWFANDVLRLNEPEEADAELRGDMRGRLYHKALELAVKRARGTVDLRTSVLEILEEEFGKAEILEEKLPHAALELGLRTAKEMRPHSEGASAEIIDEALRLARGFDEGREYRSFQLGEFRREVPVSLEINGTLISGKADLLGDDYVLDFKTDTEIFEDDHSIQLWAYSQALDRPRALVAYLRQQKLYEYKPLELAAAGQEAANAADGIQKGAFSPKPSELACGRCRYSSLCVDCFRSNN